GNMVRVKICGIRLKEDALWCLRQGVHALGLVFYKKSPRFIHPKEARELVRTLPPLASWVGVFVDKSPVEVLEICKWVGLDTVQLHGSEPPEASQFLRQQGLRVIKAVRISEEEDLNGWEPYKDAVSAILLDTKVPDRPGGSGNVFDWQLAKAIEGVPLILAGGLNPKNVRQALEAVKPYAVDVSSGVEQSPGKKDPKLVEDFMREVLRYEDFWR
ncbi:MAG: phosphoribosylanthranilate isomerase, partial [Desulfatiglandales bacterium]